MAIFGDYETIGDPLPRTVGHAQDRTLWTAKRRSVKDGRLYLIKSVALLGAALPKELIVPPSLTADPGADFFESVTRLKEAHFANPHAIAPIHDFGTTESGVWYATDYYPRRSLAELQRSPGDLDDTALRHVIYSVTSGCIALQRATGRSHGNLKASNVLLEGKPRALRVTPLRLTDTAGSAALQRLPNDSAARLDATSSTAIREATEICDLHSIGELIRELIDSNFVAGQGNTSQPIDRSIPQSPAGDNSERWLDLCNRLLDPNLSLAEISLESLAKESKQRSRLNGGKTVVAGLTLTLIVAVAAYLTWSQTQSRKVTNSPVARKQTGASVQPSVSRAIANSTPALEQAKSEQETSETLPDPTSQPAVSRTPGGEFEPTKADAPDKVANATPKSVEPTTRTDVLDARPAEPTPLITSATPKSVDSESAIDSNAQEINHEPNDTKTQPQAALSKPQQIAPATPANGATPNPVGSATLPVAPSGEHYPGQPQQTRDPLPSPAPSGSSGHDLKTASPQPREIPGSGSVVQAATLRLDTGKRQGAREVEGRIQPPPLDIGQLNQELTALESQVNRAVSLNRNHKAFREVAVFEAKYPPSTMPEPYQKRLRVLRANMTRKLVGPPPDPKIIEPYIPPIVGR